MDGTEISTLTCSWANASKAQMIPTDPPQCRVLGLFTVYVVKNLANERNLHEQLLKTDGVPPHVVTSCILPFTDSLSQYYLLGHYY